MPNSILPNPPPGGWTDLIGSLIWISLACAGGVAKYLDGYIRTGVAPTLGILFAHIVVSGFSGYMLAQTVINISPDWALVAAGVGGYLGIQGLDFISSFIRSKLGGVGIDVHIHDKTTTKDEGTDKTTNKDKGDGKGGK